MVSGYLHSRFSAQILAESKYTHLPRGHSREATVHHVLSDQMLKSRIVLLSVLTACLLRSPALFSGSGFVSDDDTVEQITPLPISIISESLDDGPRPRAAEAVNSTLSHAEPTNAVGLDTDVDTADLSSAEIDTLATKEFSDKEIANLRQLFLQAEVVLEKGDSANFFLLADQLEDYPLYPYLQYQWLKKHLNYERQIKHYLEQHASSRYAATLKHKWLYQLAKQRQWKTFLEYYTDTTDTSLNCYYHQAQFITGDKQAALNGAKELWVAGYSQPKACDPLFAELEKSSFYNRDLFWRRFDAALQSNNSRLATYIKGLMPKTDQNTADLCLNLYRNPERYIPQLLTRTSAEQAPLMFTHAIDRLANNDINRAITLWDNNRTRFNLSKEDTDKLEKRLAYKLAYENEAGAYERLGQLNESDTSSKSRRIRVALYEQNWPRVIAAIQDLSIEDQQETNWQYWLARAYQETGESLRSEKLFSMLSEKRDFYGYLAAERLNRLYQLSDKPTDATPQEIADIKNRKEFRVAFEFMVLERDNDAKLQWWHALRQLNKNEYPAAAKLAQQWQWDEIAIFTIAKVQQWDDIKMRFPLSYSDNIHENAAEQKLNPVILFGLVRRESAFNKNARSPSGAQGLMQIMPQTARQIAKDLNESRADAESMYNPVKNIQYGSYYYQKLLSQFDGHYAIALAAYNAGPNRVKQWLPDKSVPADIWIETIPYTETRNYVTSVLVYAMIYQQRMQSNELTMSDFTRDVQPLVMLP